MERDSSILSGSHSPLTSNQLFKHVSRRSRVTVARKSSMAGARGGALGHRVWSGVCAALCKPGMPAGSEPERPPVGVWTAIIPGAFRDSLHVAHRSGRKRTAEAGRDASSGKASRHAFGTMERRGRGMVATRACRTVRTGVVLGGLTRHTLITRPVGFPISAPRGVKHAPQNLHEGTGCCDSSLLTGGRHIAYSCHRENFRGEGTAALGRPPTIKRGSKD